MMSGLTANRSKLAFISLQARSECLPKPPDGLFVLLQIQILHFFAFPIHHLTFPFLVP